MSDAPIQNYRFIRKLIPGVLHPTIRGIRKRLTRPPGIEEPYRSVYPYTQAHPTRQENLVRLCGVIDRDKVPGAVVECGVLDGGTAALMAYGTASAGRDVHLFDSWEGLPEISPEDGDSGMWVGEDVGSPRRVAAIMKALNVDRRRLHYHKGWFEQTFLNADIPEIALLHVDGDFYESVRLTLETWAPKVSPGGYIQIDDYGAFVGCTKAVDEFLARNPRLKLDYVERYARAYFIRL